MDMIYLVEQNKCCTLIRGLVRNTISESGQRDMEIKQDEECARPYWLHAILLTSLVVFSFPLLVIERI